jgi:hypothetical protein
MGRKRRTAEQIVRELRASEVDAGTLAASLLSARSPLIPGRSLPVPEPRGLSAEYPEIRRFPLPERENAVGFPVFSL